MGDNVFTRESSTGFLSLSPSASPSEDVGQFATNDSAVLLTTLRIYGTSFLVLMVIFCWVRRRFPLFYNIRSWVPGYETKYSKDQFGFFSWIWHVYVIPEEEILKECGMDAICFLRAINFGMKISLVGMLNSLWLIPTYATGAVQLSDPVDLITINHLPEGSYRFAATVLAAYIFFGATIYFLHKEFEWFTEHRHKFLSEFTPRNYTIFVRNIPREFRDNDKLRDFFGRVFGRGNVLEAWVDLKVPGLQKRCEQRDAALAKLEHAIATRNMLGNEKMSLRRDTEKKNAYSPCVQVRAVKAYTKDLTELHASVRKGLRRLERRRQACLNKEQDKRAPDQNTAFTSRSISFGVDDSCELRHRERLDTSLKSVSGPQLEENTENAFNDGEVHIILDGIVNPSRKSTSTSSRDPNQVTMKGRRCSGDQKNQGKRVVAGRRYDVVASKIGGAHEALDERLMRSSAKIFEDYLIFKNDGSPKNAGFVTFTSITSCQAARQLVQHHTPHVMDIFEAPHPKEIFWENIGLTNWQVQFGQLGTFAITAVLLVAWTFPTVIVSNFGKIEELEGSIPFLEDLNNNLPMLQGILAQLSPLILVAMNVWILPEMFFHICKKEGHISQSSLEASVFFKVSIFTIVQTFFVTTISGSITSTLSAVAADPEKIITIIAGSLPSQSTYFLQLLLVSTLVGIPFELFRCPQLAAALGAANIGYHLTWKEKMVSKLDKLHSLQDPLEFQYARIFSNDILFFVALFTYSTLAPIINWFTAPCLLIMQVAYRHNFIFNYHKIPDSGGIMWLKFIQLVQASILIGQFTLLGYLIVKRSYVAWLFMIPLIVTTIIFNRDLTQKHFWVADFLPAERCLVVEGDAEARDFTGFKDKYVRSILKPTELVVDWEHGVSDRILKEERKKMSFKERFTSQKSNDKTAEEEEPDELVSMDEIASCCDSHSEYSHCA